MSQISADGAHWCFLVCSRYSLENKSVIMPVDKMFYIWYLLSNQNITTWGEHLAVFDRRLFPDLFWEIKTDCLNTLTCFHMWCCSLFLTALKLHIISLRWKNRCVSSSPSPRVQMSKCFLARPNPELLPFLHIWHLSSRVSSCLSVSVNCWMNHSKGNKELYSYCRCLTAHI